ncbi:YqaA family protein [Marinobacterium mangrovicola]|uniref:Membrane protein YqaA with SNARE-associated domain n=1 Tax=Marinobacterium mangrovicola TaxID=1476959 RepID=A0A4R1G501_9GAMM|nr:YqaA family protein [Marinobacterium mangrovicola]TCK02558.1 membrane protein YqaA with SNARE-associated domain [Marinobacterium mangrovicola]
MEALWAEYSLAGLFLSAFISSTLLPGGSEALLAWEVSQRGEWLLPVLVASAGNLLGSMLTFVMGVWLRRRYPLRILSERHRRAEQRLKRYGPAALLLAWLPIIGDPLCLVAGWIGFSWRSSVLLIGLGKLARYLAVAGLIQL